MVENLRLVDTNKNFELFLRQHNPNYAKLTPFLKASFEGYLSASKDEFPPRNPHAPAGIYAGDEDKNLIGAAWFYGYWSYYKMKKGETL